MLYVLDAAGVINLDSYAMGRDRFIITNKVLQEIKDPKSKDAVEIAMISTTLVVRDPSAEDEQAVRDAAQKTGDLKDLSDADISVLAVARRLVTRGEKFFMLSDDNGVQNVAKVLRIPMETIVEEPIREFVVWKLMCPQCKRTFDKDSKLDECEVCGVPLVRKKDYSTSLSSRSS